MEEVEMLRHSFIIRSITIYLTDINLQYHYSLATVDVNILMTSR